MPELSRRDVLASAGTFMIPPALLGVLAGCDRSGGDASPSADSTTEELSENTQNPASPAPGKTMKIQYLEIVTPEVEGLCAQYAATHGVTFGEPEAALGGARIAKMNDGSSLAIRGPLRETETPVVRPYVLVDDIKAAVAAAAEAGAEVALPSMELPGHGTCAVVIHGGIECGFWQNAG